MRTRQEIDRAMRHISEARAGARTLGDIRSAAIYTVLLDMLDWVRGNDRAAFTSMVMGPCDQVDRAGRQ